MSTAIHTHRRYDHRLKQLVRATGNIDIALESGVPKSTAYGWLNGSRVDVVTIDALDGIAARGRERRHVQGYELLLIADRSFHESTQIVKSCNLKDVVAHRRQVWGKNYGCYVRGTTPSSLRHRCFSTRRHDQFAQRALQNDRPLVARTC